jgi:NAD(P)-dependent dehydrogenase (short-subunit alcohol dehydrogenase family)
VYGFDDEVALITGGAAGLGFPIATRLAQEGAGGGRESGVHRQLDAVSYTSNPRTFFPSRRS